MKKVIISTLTVIALAVPLGIGGLTVTAPVTATHSEAGWNDFVNWVKRTHEQHVEFWRETVPNAFQNSFRKTRERHQRVVEAFDSLGDTIRDEFENSFQRTRERHQQIATAFNNHFGTCSADTIWACDSSIHSHILGNNDAFLVYGPSYHRFSLLSQVQSSSWIQWKRQGCLGLFDGCH